MKRIESYRKGDRAEKLGGFLLQAFCAVAEVPRPEDFGLVDAVATLLRREGKYVHAEDSFLVQFKSRTEKCVDYCDERFKALINQELSLFLARVNLLESSIELHSVGVALSHPNINDAKGISLHLQPSESCPAGLVDDVLHFPLRKPLLRWTTADTENRAFLDAAYAATKAWLNLERWNRRYRRAGITRQINWETNAVPTEGWECHSISPTRDQEALTDIAPLARLLGGYANSHPELITPTLSILSWLRSRGVEADSSGSVDASVRMRDALGRLSKALDANPKADLAITFVLLEAGMDYLNFWEFGRNRENKGGGTRYSGSLRAIQEKGFEATVTIVGTEANVTLGVSDAWLQKRSLAPVTDVVDQPTLVPGSSRIILLRKLTES
jgi:hypothetical protein